MLRSWFEQQHLPEELERLVAEQPGADLPDDLEQLLLAEPLPETLPKLTEHVAARAYRDENFGFNLDAWNGQESGRRVDFSGHCGIRRIGAGFLNNA